MTVEIRLYMNLRYQHYSQRSSISEIWAGDLSYEWRYMHGHFFCQLNILNIAKGIYKSFQDIGLMPWYYMKPKQRITEKSFDESMKLYIINTLHQQCRAWGKCAITSLRGLKHKNWGSKKKWRFSIKILLTTYSIKSLF